MAYEQKDMSGSLFRNERREKDTHPNLEGQCVIDGVSYWVSGWTKEGKSGKWISLSFKRKDKSDTRSHAERKRPDLDDVPF